VRRRGRTHRPLSPSLKSSSPARTRRLDPVLIGIVLLLCGLVGSTAFLWVTSSSGIDGTRRARTVDRALGQAGWQIRYLDEVLTHSAARYAATGDDRWRVRYDTSVANLDAVLKNANKLASPEDLAPLRRVDGANQALIVMETKVFRLGAQHRLAAAQATMGAEYEVQKAIYKQGVDEFFSTQQRRLVHALRAEESRLWANLIEGLIVCVVLAISLMLLLRVHRRARAVTLEQAERLLRQTRIDPLTGLLNRLGGKDAIHDALADRAAGPGVTALFIDLDGFKAINDSFGHAAGDEVLIEIARRFEREIGSSAVLVRLGGDEFLVVVPDSDHALQLAERLLKVAADPILAGGDTTSVTASIGVAIAKAHDDAAALMRHADQAVYEAKANGKRRIVVFDGVLERKVNEAAAIQQEIQAGLINDEFEIHLQPIVETETGHVAGAEALARWQHPRRGLLMPDRFIPIAEGSWLIVEIGRTVLLAACRQLAAWQSAARPQYIAVNISARHVIHGDLVGNVIAALQQSGAKPEGLQIELTETHLIADMDRAISVLGRLRRLGVKVALDDFGEGHASLGYLRRLPLDTLKIDRSYIEGVDAPHQYALVSNIVQLGRILGLRLVAEGVERVEELDALRRLGCDFSQGYLIARPMPPDALDRWLTERAAASDRPADAFDPWRAAHVVG
jgi:diguanylate cyclase (GGDEF)-like protein